MLLSIQFRLLIPALLVLAIGVSFAQERSSVSQAEVQTSLKRLQDATDPNDAAKQTSLDLLRRAAVDLKAAEQFKAEAQKFSDVAGRARSERDRIASELAIVEPRTTAESMKSLSPEDLEAKLLDLKSEIVATRGELTQIKESTQAERNLALESLIDEARQSAAGVEGNLRAELDGGLQAPVVQIVKGSREQLRQARLNALQQRLLSRPVRLALMEDQAELLARELGDFERSAAAIQLLLNQRRTANAESLVDRLTGQLSSLQAAPSQLRSFAEQNVELAQNLTSLLAYRHRAERDLSAYDDVLSGLEAKAASLSRFLTLQQFESTASFGTALRRESDASRQTIDVSVTREIAEKSLTASRIALFEIEEQRAPYEVSGEVSLLPSADDSATWARAAESALKSREDLLSQLRTNHRRHADELLTLLDLLARVKTRSIAYRDLLNSHLFWIPSAEPFGLKGLAAASDSLEWILRPSHWNQVVEVVRKNLSNNSIQYALGMFLFLASVFGRKALKRRLTEMEPRIGKVRTDRFTLTLIALGVTFLLALPIPLLIFWFADLTKSFSGFPSGLSIALLTAGATLLFMEFFLQLVRPKGVAQVHFRWRTSTLALAQRIDRWLMVVLIPTVVVMVLLALEATPEIRDGMGRVTLVLLCLTIAAATYQLSKASRIADDNSSETSRLTVIGYPLLITSMGALVMLSLLGYHYTSTQLLARVIQSMFTAMAALLVYYILDRASNVYERRLALERLVAKRVAAAAQNADREAAEKSGEAIPEVVDSQEIDRHTISNQTSAVLRMVVWIGLIIALAGIWRDLLPVGRSLNDWIVWQVSSDNPALQPQDITLWSLIVALSVFLVSFVAVKNLPGVLEVAILSRFKLAPGSGYAITTVVKYLILIIGAISITNLLGADWSKLQWLVAALGVGLGFGLQEIVANFVSGIIILFERPFRLGDTVTIGGQTGTVSKIQTRATTIIDWDRKELIIPNKSFVTNDFVNWTLSDATTRLIIPVGVAYGSEVQVALDSLLKVARQNPKVLEEPAPAALFLEFGDNSLNFELRVFTRSIADRLMLTHDLHLAIEQSFREQEIEISYPQRDVHLSATNPIAVTIKSDPA